MGQFLGTAAIFMTISPSMMDNIQCLELCLSSKDKAKITIPIDKYICSLSLQQRRLYVTRNPIAQAVAFNQLITTVFRELLQVQLVGYGSRIGTKKQKTTGENGWGIFGRVNGACMTVETQRLEGLHGHALVFGGYITPEKLGEIAHQEQKLKRLLQKAPDISSVYINTVTKRALPTHKVKTKAGYKTWAVDPRVGNTPFLDLDSFHYQEPGLQELLERYHEMMAIPGNVDLDVPIIPHSWAFGNSRRMRMSEGGEIEMFCRICFFICNSLFSQKYGGR